jgi:RpiR family carbohydrate utilization transcriptional regulator
MRNNRSKGSDRGDNRDMDVAEIVRRISRKRKELIRPILENPGDYVLLSVRSLAQKLGKDPATTLRIVQGMGFRAYRDFQRYLQNLSVVHATPLNLMKSAAKPGAGTLNQIKHSFDQDLKNVQSIRHSVDSEGLIRVAEQVYSAKRLLVIGGDQAASLVDFLQYNLGMIRLMALSCTSAGQIAHAVRSLGTHDLLFAISFGRGLRQTVEGLKIARSKGAYCVGITDTFISPIAKFSHRCFVASVESPSFGGSYVAPMALLNALIVACANYRRSRTIAILKQAEHEQRTGFRWYQEL